MSGFCQLTKRGPMRGHKVSHANNKTKRVFKINLKMHRLWDEETQRIVKLKISKKGLKIIDRYGIKKALLMASKIKRGK